MPRIFKSLLLCFSLAALNLPAQAAAPDTATVSFHTYGLVRGGGDAPRALVAKRWHIEYVTVAGCLVTEELVDSAHKHNARTEAILGRRHGTEWRKKFDAEVAAEATRQKAITSRLDSSAEIKALRTKLKNDYNTPWYQFSFDERSRMYVVDVKTWDKKTGDYRTQYVLTAGLNKWELLPAGKG